MHIEGPQWKAPVPKKPKTGGLIDAIKKAAELGLAAKKLGDAIAKAPDADRTQQATTPTATSRLALEPVGGAIQVDTAEYDGQSETMAIGYRTRISSTGNGELSV